MTNAASKRTTPLASETIPFESPRTTDLSETHGKEALKDIICGSIAGIAGKIVEYPFDTVKVRLQSQPDGQPLRYAGPLDCFRQSVRDEGMRGLYRGISAPLLGAAIETSSLFFSYRVAQTLLKSTLSPSSSRPPDGKLPLRALVACGAASGAFTSLLLTPIELIKCQMQIPLSVSATLPHRSPAPLAIVSSIFRHHGLRGFWHGQLGTLIRETGGSAAWFGVYEGVSTLFRTRNQRLSSSSSSSSSSASLPIWQQMLAGACAGVSYILGFFPADTIKSRMQTESVVSGSALPNTTTPTPTPSTTTTTAAPPATPAVASAHSIANPRGVLSRATFWASGVALWRQQGVRGLYRGCGITVARAAPSSAFIFAVYEGLRGVYA